MKYFLKLSLILFSLSFLILTASCSGLGENKASDDNENGQAKLKILCTVFPQYDLARKIAGDTADIQLLLKTGTDSHNYEQTSSDIVAVGECDMFITVGGANDIWLERVLPSVSENSDKNINVISLMDCANILEEEITEGMEEEEDEHDGHDADIVEYDEHVWTNPNNMIKIAKEICRVLIELDRENEAFYTDNLESVTVELEELDKEIRELIDNADNKTLIFGDRFAFRYFTEEYGLDYYAAFPGCSTDTDASAQTIAFLIEKVKNLNIPVVYYLENGTHKIAETICRETGAEAIMLNSCHTVSQEQLDSGVGYIELMRGNLENLKKGLY